MRKETQNRKVKVHATQATFYKAIASFLINNQALKTGQNIKYKTKGVKNV